MTITVKLKTPTPHSHCHVCEVRTLKTYSLSKFQAYSIVLLTVITTLFIRFLGLIHLFI